MGTLGSGLTGLGNVQTAGEPPDGAGTAGPPGGVASVTATVPAVVDNTIPTAPVIQVAAAAPPAVGPASVGTSNDLSRGNHTHTTTEVANIAALALVDCATWANGAYAYVATLKARFELKATTITADGISVVAALNKVLSRWCRVLERNLAYEQEAAWEIDPVNGQDEAAGTTSATSIQTFRELARRLWCADIRQNVTVTVRGNVPNTDSNAFTAVPRIGTQITIIGTLGAVTGFGGAAIDNTLFTGAITTYTAGSATPAADDVRMSDASIPVSFTASGLLARGVIFRRTVTATRHWYAVSDLGTKTIRITVPMNNVGPANFSSNPLVAGNPYNAYAMWTCPPQTFGFADALGLRIDTLHAIEASGASADEEGGPRGYAPLRSRIYIGLRPVSPFMTLGLGLTNCMINVGGDAIFSFATQIPPNLIGGGAIGTGATKYIFFGQGGVGGAFTMQGCRIELNDWSYFTVEAGLAIHDVIAAACITSVGNGRLGFLNVGLSGMGNTGKLVSVTSGGSLYYGNAAVLPPFVAGSTTDANPITIGAVNYTVAAMPATADTMLTPALPFPYGPRAVANGVVALALGATGPAGLPANPVRYVQVPDGAGGFYTFPSWT